MARGCAGEACGIDGKAPGGTAGDSAVGAEIAGAAGVPEGMGSFDFDTPIDRRGIGSLKWDCGKDELPMWVADMDFAAAPAIMRALRERVERGTFGYSIIPDDYRRSVAGWWQRRHGVSFDPSHIVFVTGVIPALTSIIRSLTNVGERVVVQSPVYNNFYSSIQNTGRRVAENRLVFDGDAYHVDFDDLERCLKDDRTTLMVLCNPHNPGGAVWDRDTLARIGEACARNRVTVVSDEIHCDVMRPGTRHVPFAAASDVCRSISVTLGSPSKAFNVAGLQSAYAIADDLLIRNRVERGFNNDEIAEPNDFAIAATVAAYDEGAAWLDAACAYIQQSKDYARDAINAAACGVRALDSDATYLLWLDCRELLAKGEGCGTGAETEAAPAAEAAQPAASVVEVRSAGASDAAAPGMRQAAAVADLVAFLRRETGLILSSGDIYGTGGEGFIRMNLGTQRCRVEDGVRRFIEGCTAFARR